jgi:hypothetical protein
VGRAELLEWINTTLHLSYTKVEQCFNGKLHKITYSNTSSELALNGALIEP